MIEPLRISFEVLRPPDEAFAIWTGAAHLWWPAGHRATAESGTEVTFEPFAGGRVFERTSDGEEHEWGEVLAWEPPERLVYLWHLRFDRADATEVEITFTATEQGCRVDIEHRGWERLGDRGPERRERNAHGWATVVPYYENACAR